MSIDKKALGQQLKSARLALSPQEAKIKSELVKNLIESDPRFIKAKHIAFYIAMKGELDIAPLMTVAINSKKQCYLPRINTLSPPLLAFEPVGFNSALIQHKFGMLEPQATEHFLSAQELDLIIMPLVGFDLFGNRLGMGGGFYDYSLKDRQALSPIKLGVGFEVQCTDQLEPESHDISLDVLVTENKITNF